MPEGYIQSIVVDALLGEPAAKTRERLKGEFAGSASRRMSQLGLLVGSTLGKVGIHAEDTLIYLTEYGEARSLETFLDSFPSPSPTAFQSSIHPSGVQQGLIARQFPLREFFPLVGRTALVSQGLLVAAVSPAERVILCGGEEEGTWMREAEGASERAFAFAMVSSRVATGALAHWQLTWTGSADELRLEAWVDRLAKRESFELPAGRGWRLKWEWLQP